MKKALYIGLVVLTIVLSAYLLLKLIDLLIYILDCILSHPLHTLIWTIGAMTLLYIYFKIQDRYRR
jgi:hypothetical protein